MSTDIEAPEAVETLRSVGGSFRSIVDDLRESASVESVYGDPVEVEGVTVIPVARVAYGFGGGFGRGPDETGESDADDGGEGGGVGGGVSAKPVGVVEVSEGQTRFVRFGSPRGQLVTLVVGVLVGYLLRRRRGRE